ncbi:MAG: hypothetical protein NTW25_00370 [Candidatus Kapabacteria bacterium]|nr:hypothetical protein [Candidatus Kapabacteria bacterium]
MRNKDNNLKTIKDLLQNQNEKPIFLFGNGINIYNDGTNNDEICWNKLINSIANHENSENIQIVNSSLIERYEFLLLDKFLNSELNKDALDIRTEKEISNKFLDDIESKIEDINSISKQNFLEVLKKYKINALTTNFEYKYLDSSNYSYQSKDTIISSNDTTNKIIRFSSYYPINVHYRLSENSKIYFPHGIFKMKDSIKLSFHNYLKTIEYFRKLLPQYTFEKKRNETKSDYLENLQLKFKSSWLFDFFTKDIIIFGLGLGQDELFLRWLFIERYRFNNLYSSNNYIDVVPNPNVKTYYINFNNENNINELKDNNKIENKIKKNVFFESLGIHEINFSNYSDFYKDLFNELLKDDTK